MQPAPDDQEALDALTARMLAAFGNAGGRTPDWDELRDVFHPGCVIAKIVEPTAQVQTLDEFIAQRRPLLTDGRLVDFAEWESAARTWACGHIAGRWSVYEKAGVLDGTPFHTRGIKQLQFVKLEGTWRISALAWDDERPGLVIPTQL